MTRRVHGGRFKPSERIAALAEATQVYAERLDDADLVNLYWGKSLGLWQAFEMLIADERLRPGRRGRRHHDRRWPRRGPDQSAAG